MRQVDFLGKGFKFPLNLQQTRTGKKLAWANSSESINDAIFIILETSPGERIMRPTFGSELSQLVFAPNNHETATMATYYVKEALRKWEPRINVESVVTTPSTTQQNLMEIYIEYTIITDNTSANLVYPFYLENI